MGSGFGGELLVKLRSKSAEALVVLCFFFFSGEDLRNFGRTMRNTRVGTSNSPEANLSASRTGGPKRAARDG